KAVNLSLEHGNCDASCLAYVLLGKVAVQRFGDYQTAFRFGQIGFDLVERCGLKRFQAAVYFWFAAWIAPWMKHVRTSADLSRRPFDIANQIGDLTHANYANLALDSELLVAGGSLSDVQRQAELGVAFAKKRRFGSTALAIPPLVLTRTLRGLTSTFGC